MTAADWCDGRQAANVVAVVAVAYLGRMLWRISDQAKSGEP